MYISSAVSQTHCEVFSGLTSAFHGIICFMCGCPACLVDLRAWITVLELFAIVLFFLFMTSAWTVIMPLAHCLDYLPGTFVQ